MEKQSRHMLLKMEVQSHLPLFRLQLPAGADIFLEWMMMVLLLSYHQILWLMN